MQNRVPCAIGYRHRPSPELDGKPVLADLDFKVGIVQRTRLSGSGDPSSGGNARLSRQRRHCPSGPSRVNGRPHSETDPHIPGVGFPGRFANGVIVRRRHFVASPVDGSGHQDPVKIAHFLVDIRGIRYRACHLGPQRIPVTLAETRDPGAEGGDRHSNAGAISSWSGRGVAPPARKGFNSSSH